MKTNKKKLVVIGNGMAGARTVEEILARGGADQFQITMFGEEPTGNYNRILLSNVLNGSYSEEDIFLNPLAWYDENNIRLLSGKRASGLLRRARLAYGEDGAPEPYDKLILATGSRAFVPPIEGVTMVDGTLKPGVFVFRTLEDCRNIAAWARGKKTAAVIGGGLLGLEAARGLQNFGLDVHVVHNSGHLMQQQLDGGAGAILKTSMEALGLHVHLKKSTTTVIGPENVLGLRFTDGATLECDMVIISAGIKANWEIAAAYAWYCSTGPR